MDEKNEEELTPTGDGDNAPGNADGEGKTDRNNGIGGGRDTNPGEPGEPGEPEEPGEPGEPSDPHVNRTTDRWAGLGDRTGQGRDLSVRAGSVSLITGKYKTPVGESLPREQNDSYRTDNQIKVSATNDPFAFPPETSYTVGDGRILAEATIQLDISDRNFGSYPTFVFTTTGVYELAGSRADEVHASMSSPTFMEPPLSGVIRQTPWGIAYPSRSGIMLLVSRYNTTNISLALWGRRREPYPDFVPEGLLKDLGDFDYKAFLTSPELMLYDPHQEELQVMSGQDRRVVAVYSFHTQQWHMMERKLRGELLELENAYPRVEVYGADEEGTIYSQRWDTAEYVPSVRVAMVTRPMVFGTTYIKNVKRLWLRAWLEGCSEGSWGVGWSESGVYFHDVTQRRGEGLHPFAKERARHVRDLDSGLLPKDKARYFAVALEATMGRKSHIEAIEIEHNYTYVSNDKLR